MGKITILKDKLIFERRDELTVIEAYGENCLRCRSTKNSKLLDENWTLLPPASESECFVEGDEKVATIRNGMVSATIEAGQPWYGGIISYYRKDRQILHTKFEGEYTGRNVHTEGDHYQIKVIFDANEGEHFFTVSDKNRRISSIGKEAPVICSIIIQSQQFRLYILHLDMDFYGTTRHRDGVKQQTIIRCGWQIVPIRLII